MLTVGRGGKVVEESEDGELVRRSVTEDLNYILTFDEDFDKETTDHLSREGLQRIIHKVTTLGGSNDREQKNLLEIKDRKHHFKTYTDCFIGSEAIDKFMQVSDICKTREDALRVGQRMMDLGLLRHVTDGQPFRDGFYFYRFTKDEKAKESPFLNVEADDTYKRDEALPTSACKLSAHLLKALKRVFKRYGDLVTLESSGSMSKTPEFKQFVANSVQYQQIDLGDLNSDDKKLQFWINTFHLVLLHAHANDGFKSLGQTRPPFNFFSNNRYNIAGHSFSLLEIEHAVLRAQMSAPNVFLGASFFRFPKFPETDPRRPFALREAVPEISLVLSTATISSPPIRIYTSHLNIRERLKEASEQYLRDTIHEKDGYAVLPKTLKWYTKDFGANTSEMILAVAAYYENFLEFLTIIRQNNSRVTFAYDWKFRVVFAGKAN